jgi:hypothetical protein
MTTYRVQLVGRLWMGTLGATERTFEAHSDGEAVTEVYRAAGDFSELVGFHLETAGHCEHVTREIQPWTPCQNGIGADELEGLYVDCVYPTWEEAV